MWFLLRLLLFLITLFPACAKKSPYPVLTVSGGEVRIETGTLSHSTPHFYSIVSANKRIDFFVIMFDDRVESYFDACERCASKKQGYRHDVHTVVCRSCGTRFPVASLRKGLGICHPLPLRGIETEGRYVIQVDAIAEGSKYF